MLAADAHTLLRGGGAVVGALLHAQEGILELIHAGVGQEQRRVILRHQAAAGDDLMTVLVKEIQKKLADLAGRQVFHKRRFPCVQCKHAHKLSLRL
jgi:hypothetical protein